MGTGLFTIADMLTAVGADAVRIQERFDRAHEVELERCAPAVRALHAVLGDAASGLVPARMQIRRHEVDMRVGLARERRAGGALGVRLLNQSHDLLYARSADASARDSRMTITITQVPAAAAEEASAAAPAGTPHTGRT